MIKTCHYEEARRSNLHLKAIHHEIATSELKNTSALPRNDLLREKI